MKVRIGKWFEWEGDGEGLAAWSIAVLFIVIVLGGGLLLALMGIK